MQDITTVVSLLKIANVSRITAETLPQILQTLTDNKIRLREQALDEMLELLRSAPSVMTVAYETIQRSTEKANITNDKLSLEYIKELLDLFKSSGISDERISKLLKKLEQHEHEIRLERTKGVYSLAKIALVTMAAVAVSVITRKPPNKYPFWYK